MIKSLVMNGGPLNDGNIAECLYPVVRIERDGERLTSHVMIFVDGKELSLNVAEAIVLRDALKVAIGSGSDSG